jgi:hypothetical protein
MPEFLFRAALKECRDEIRRAIGSDVTVDERGLDEFLELFVADFSSLLSNPRGDAIWRRDGRHVRRLGRYIGTLAEFYAVAAGNGQTVDHRHFMKALRIVQPECKLRASGENTERQEYCKKVIVNPD